MKPAFAGLHRRVNVGLALLAWAARSLADDPTSVWPKHLDTALGRCTVFEPRAIAREGDRLSARSAIAVAREGSTNVVFGIAQIDARVAQNVERNQTTVSELKVGDVKFAPADATAMTGLTDMLKVGLATVSYTVGTPELQAGLEAAERERNAALALNTEPPKIYYSPVPAALIILDGPPELRALTNSTVMRVVNSPYAMVFQPAEKRYWLLGGSQWYSAPDWKGEWSAVGQPPTEVLDAVPKGTKTQASTSPSPATQPQRIIVSAEPAELVVTRGEPTYTPVDGNDLLYVSNSDQLLFLTLDTRQHYVALSGRWYRSTALEGPWEYVSADQLPTAFARIPPGSPKSEALTYVSGTQEAKDAVLQAKIPQIAAVPRETAAAPVTYDGPAKFQTVENTGVQYATNTSDAVFLVRGAYYLCRDAVWYSGPGPDGPWSVAMSVPPEIQSLPPTNPHYNVKYVYVYGATPEVVYVGYEPGYSGCYVYGPTVVYGTGWWYPGYYGPGYYWAYPATFGFGFGYSSWSGWSVGLGFSYGWLGCGYGWGWGGCYPWGWWGPCGAYWACAPRYPCYGGYRGGHHPPGGPPPDGRPPGGRPGGGNPGDRPPPPGGGHGGYARSEVRGDVPGPNDRPGNPQRRSLPAYARTAKAPSQAPTNLGSGQATAARPGMGMSPARSAGSGRMEVPNRSVTGAPGRSVGMPPNSGQPNRPQPTGTAGPTVRSDPRSLSSPSTRAPTPSAVGGAPTRSMPSGGPGPQAVPGDRGGYSAPPANGTATRSVPQRTSSLPVNSWPGARSGATTVNAPATPRGIAPMQSSANTFADANRPAAPVYAPTRTPPGAGVYSQRSPVAVPRSNFSAPGYGASPSRMSAPAYGGYGGSRSMTGYGPMRSAPTWSGSGSGSFRSMGAAPVRSGFAPSSFGSMGSAPMRSSGGFSGGAPTRGGGGGFSGARGR